MSGGPWLAEVARAVGARTRAVVDVQGVSVRYGARRVLDRVDLSVRAGELVALVGPNGAGKSTLLAALSGDLAAHEGRVLLDGRALRDWSLRDLARRRAVLLQEQRVSFPFAVLDVVRMGRAPWAGTDREDQDDDVVARALAQADVVDLADRRFGTLSGGEKARTGFARALAQEPGVLLLDEPTAALDIRHQESVLARVRALADEGLAVVVVLHDLSLAAAWADRVVVLHDGQVRADGTPRDVLTADLLGEVYGHPVEVLTRPGTDEVVVLPVRPARAPTEGVA
ncbi:heme ABC transporter ATP-binding protein [Cellulomonas soli]|uniref:heme ABC transporter ATP-binding protein n=1 Tax=Cellulomonas soli TaxID=931535 RepID=UPI003F860A5A